jgi:hypothetical protein
MVSRQRPEAESLARAIGCEASAAALDEVLHRIVAPVLNDASAAGDFELPCTRTVYKLLLSGDLPGAASANAEASESTRLSDAEGTVIWDWDGKASTLNAPDRRQVTVPESAGEPGVFLYLPTRDPILLLPLCAQYDRLSQNGGLLEFDRAWRGTINPASQ